MNNITFIQIHLRSDYGTKMEINPKCNIFPDHPNWAPLLIIRERHVVSSRVLIKLPLVEARLRDIIALKAYVAS